MRNEKYVDFAKEIEEAFLKCMHNTTKKSFAIYYITKTKSVEFLRQIVFDKDLDDCVMHVAKNLDLDFHALRHDLKNVLNKIKFNNIEAVRAIIEYFVENYLEIKL